VKDPSNQYCSILAIFPLLVNIKRQISEIVPLLFANSKGDLQK